MINIFDRLIRNKLFLSILYSQIRKPQSNQYQMSISKQTAVSNTKTSRNNHPKSIFSISDVNRLYRRQENYKKKLKALSENNSLLEQRIKIFQATIKDERSTILFQLNQLSKTMNSKVSTYIDQHLDKDQFSDNDKALETIKSMITKFEVVQKETSITKKVHQSLNAIHQKYLAYSQEINNLVKLTQKSNKDYQDSMKNMLELKQSQISKSRQKNQDIYDQTQTMIKNIDDYEADRLKLIEQEKQLKNQIQQLNQIEQNTIKQVRRFNEWAQIVIDKNHRKNFNKQTKQKHAQLSSLQEQNKSLQMYFRQLQTEQQLVKNQLKEKEKEIAAFKKLKTLSMKKNNSTKM